MKGALAIALAVLALAPCAQASYDPLSGGTTTLTLDRGFLAFLKRNDVKLGVKGPARINGNRILLPVSGGRMDPTIGRGEVDQEGQVLFQRGERSLPFKKLALKTKKAPFYAKVGGSQLKVLTAQRISSARNGFGSGFSARGLALTDKVAIRLNKKLHLGKAFYEGQLLGSLRSRPEPITVTVLAQGRAALVPDPSFMAKLKSLFVSFNPIAPTELSPGSTFSLPIIGGSIAPRVSSGTLRLGGSVELLQQSSGQVFWTEPWLDFAIRQGSAEENVQPAPPFSGKLGRVALFELGVDAVSSVLSDPVRRQVSVSGASLTLSPEAASALNQALASGQGAFSVGERFGEISFTAQGQ